mmetsp:Transcript_38837/g.90827  ORF Transcript_38837/g.90827 Transcript_38837/m.90827 type:complete len:520 (-) Transcript_38837:361-1920(-)
MGNKNSVATVAEQKAAVDQAGAPASSAPTMEPHSAAPPATTKPNDSLSAGVEAAAAHAAQPDDSLVVGAEAQAEVSAGAEAGPLALPFEKRAGFGWSLRFFRIDEGRASLVYFGDAECTRFRGAIPLECLSNIHALKGSAMALEIPMRRFELRVPSARGNDHERQQVRDAFLRDLAKASTLVPPVSDTNVLRSKYWKDERNFRARPRCKMGKASRLAHAGYPARATVLSGVASWDEQNASYAPLLAGDAVGSSCAGSWTGKIRRDEGGVPLCPAGRTGLVGKGSLPCGGPNHEVRAIVTRTDQAGSTQVVMMRKGGIGEPWVLPGGYLPPGAVGDAPPPTPSVKTMRQAFMLQAAHLGASERNNVRLLEIFDRSVSSSPTSAVSAPAPASDLTVPGSAPADADAADAPSSQAVADTAKLSVSEAPADGAAEWLIHLGFTDDEINTDNAWVESAVGHFHCPAGVGDDLLLQEGVQVSAVRWISVTAVGTAGHGFWEDVKPLHRAWVRQAMLHRSARSLAP